MQARSTTVARTSGCEAAVSCSSGRAPAWCGRRQPSTRPSSTRSSRRRSAPRWPWVCSAALPRFPRADLVVGDDHLVRHQHPRPDHDGAARLEHAPDRRRLRLGEPDPLAAAGTDLELRGGALGHDRRNVLGALLPGLRARADPRHASGVYFNNADAHRVGPELQRPERPPLWIFLGGIVMVVLMDDHPHSPACGRRSAGRTSSGSSPRSGRSSRSSSCCFGSTRGLHDALQRVQREVRRRNGGRCGRCSRHPGCVTRCRRPRRRRSRPSSSS